MDKFKYKEKFAKAVCSNCKYFFECFLDKNFNDKIIYLDDGVYSSIKKYFGLKEDENDNYVSMTLKSPDDKEAMKDKSKIKTQFKSCERGVCTHFLKNFIKENVNIEKDIVVVKKKIDLLKKER